MPLQEADCGPGGRDLRHVRQAQTYPHLNRDMMERIAGYGSEEAVPAGTMLFQRGQRIKDPEISALASRALSMIESWARKTSLLFEEKDEDEQDTARIAAHGDSTGRNHFR